MKRTVMKRTVTLCLLMILSAFAASQQVQSKYVGGESGEPVALFLVETGALVEGAVMPQYGLILPFQAQGNGDTFRGELLNSEPVTTVEGRFEGNELVLTIVQGGERQEFNLVRQEGEAATFEGSAPLLRMLSLVPDGLLSRVGTPGVAYVDFRAIERAGGVENPGSATDYALMSETDRSNWLTALRRVSTGPRDLVVQFAAQVEGMPEILGFEWFDMDRGLSYAPPPGTTTIIAVEPDAEALVTRLGGRGFEESVRGGISVWHKGEDGAISIADRDPGDPFGGNMGKSQRIALLPGHLVNSAFWATTEAVVQATTGEAPSLAQAPDYRTLAEAAADPSTGELVQAMFLQPAEVGLMPGDPARFIGMEPEEVQDRLRAEAEEAKARAPLPFYGLALLADKQAGDDWVGVAALLYEDFETAEVAAAELTRRLATFVTAQFPEASFGADEPQVHESESGHFAAVAAIRFPGSEARGEAPQGGFGDWVRALMLREFDVLEISAAP
ncbi:MAG: hypothetical protein WD273_06385 [Trueperaceae bacterium]